MLTPSEVWVGALLRRAQLSGAFGVVVRRGDSRAGAVFVKIVNLRAKTARLYCEATRADGESIWIEPRPGAVDADLDAYLQKATRIDPDAWVVEIEDLEGRHFLTEPVE